MINIQGYIIFADDLLDINQNLWHAALKNNSSIKNTKNIVIF